MPVEKSINHGEVPERADLGLQELADSFVEALESEAKARNVRLEALKQNDRVAEVRRMVEAFGKKCQEILAEPTIEKSAKAGAMLHARHEASDEMHNIEISHEWKATAEEDKAVAPSINIEAPAEGKVNEPEQILRGAPDNGRPAVEAAAAAKSNENDKLDDIVKSLDTFDIFAKSESPTIVANQFHTDLWQRSVETIEQMKAEGLSQEVQKQVASAQGRASERILQVVESKLSTVDKLAELQGIKMEAMIEMSMAKLQLNPIEFKHNEDEVEEEITEPAAASKAAEPISAEQPITAVENPPQEPSSEIPKAEINLETVPAKGMREKGIAKAVVGGLYNILTRVGGIKFATDMALWAVGKGDIAEYQRGKKEVAVQRADIESAVTKLMQSASIRRNRAEAAPAVWSKDEVAASETNLKAAVKEYKEKIAAAKNISPDEKKDFLRQMGLIMNEYKLERRDGNIPSTMEDGSLDHTKQATELYIKNKIRGLTIARDAVNLALVGAGLGAARVATYGGLSVGLRMQAAETTFGKEELRGKGENVLRRAKGEIAVEKYQSKSEIPFILKDLFINATRENIRGITGRGKKEGSKHKVKDFIASASTILTGAGILYAGTHLETGDQKEAINRLLDDVEAHGLWKTIGHNFVKNAEKFIPGTTLEDKFDYTGMDGDKFSEIQDKIADNKAEKSDLMALDQFKLAHPEQYEDMMDEYLSKVINIDGQIDQREIDSFMRDSTIPQDDKRRFLEKLVADGKLFRDDDHYVIEMPAPEPQMIDRAEFYALYDKIFDGHISQEDRLQLDEFRQNNPFQYEELIADYLRETYHTYDGIGQNELEAIQADHGLTDDERKMFLDQLVASGDLHKDADGNYTLDSYASTETVDIPVEQLERFKGGGLKEGLHYENIIDSTKLASADSIWRSTREMLMQHPQDFGYHGDLGDNEAIFNWAEKSTGDLVEQLAIDQGGQVQDLVHNGDKISLDIINGKPYLEFESASGIEAGSLGDLRAETPRSEFTIPVHESSITPETMAGVHEAAPEEKIASMHDFMKDPSAIYNSHIFEEAKAGNMVEEVYEAMLARKDVGQLGTFVEDYARDNGFSPNKARIFFGALRGDGTFDNFAKHVAGESGGVTKIKEWMSQFDSIVVHSFSGMKNADAGDWVPVEIHGRFALIQKFMTGSWPLRHDGYFIDLNGDNKWEMLEDDDDALKAVFKKGLPVNIVNKITATKQEVK